VAIRQEAALIASAEGGTNMVTKVIWQNRKGGRMEHSMGFQCSRFYAGDWFRRSILECQGILSRDERRESKLKLLEIQNAAQEDAV